MATGYPSARQANRSARSAQLTRVTLARRRYGGARASVDHRRRTERLLRGRIAGGPAAPPAPAINDYLAGDPGYDHVVATKDYHIDPGDHFADRPDYSRHGRPTVSPAARRGFHPDSTPPNRGRLPQGRLHRGLQRLRGRRRGRTPLLDWLRQRGVDEVDIVGIATDHRVRTPPGRRRSRLQAPGSWSI